MRKLHGFTLLEIIIVLVIIMAVMGLGVIAYSNFTKSTIVNEGAGDLISILKETQNLAKNNNLPSSESIEDKATSIYYYVIVIKSDNIDRLLYRKKDNIWSPIKTDSNIKSKALANVEYIDINAFDPECRYILFENLTGRIRISKNENLDIANLLASGEATCNLTVNLVNEPETYKKQIFVDASKGSFGSLNE